MALLPVCYVFLVYIAIKLCAPIQVVIYIVYLHPQAYCLSLHRKVNRYNQYLQFSESKIHCKQLIEICSCQTQVQHNTLM